MVTAQAIIAVAGSVAGMEAIAVLDRLEPDVSECTFVGAAGAGKLKDALDAGLGRAVHHDGFDRHHSVASPAVGAARCVVADHHTHVGELVDAVPETTVVRNDRGTVAR